MNFAYPNWVRPSETRSNDPLFPEQWHLENTGQGGGLPGADANLVSVWESGVFGTGVTIAIIDDGVEIRHEDLAENLPFPGLSFDYVDGDTDPTGGEHGTAVAGVAAARGYNGIGVRGAAPYANLVGYRLLEAKTDVNEANALQRADQLVWISNNSWGPTDDGETLRGPSALTLAALEGATTSGRAGKGTVFVWAAGNGALYNDNSNYDGYANSRYTIAVGASTNEGTHAPYSEPGANVLVNAPCNGGTLGITTTSRTGGAGYAPGGPYTDSFGGTSSATPLVSGVIALALEVNPALTWRDVKKLLATTSTRNDPSDSDWLMNAAGLWINHKYGYGCVDAAAVVDAARDWIPLGPEASTEVEVAASLPIDDSPSPDKSCGPWISSSIDIAKHLNVEFVAVDFQSYHPRWGDLEIRLISAEGTESVLAEPHSNGTGNAFAEGWTFGVERLIGESSAGVWTLWARDCRSGHAGNIEKWGLTIYGARPTIGAPSFDSIGLFDPSTARFFLRKQLSPGYADVAIRFGPQGTDWVPLTGDWLGEGFAGIGLYNSSTGSFYLKNDLSNGSADKGFRFGAAGQGWQPVVGDWDGDGVDTVGLCGPNLGAFYLINSNISTTPDLVIPYSPSSGDWLPVVGDWNGDGRDSIGLYDPMSGTFHLKDSNTIDSAENSFSFGPERVSWRPIAGDWDRDGKDGIGLYDPAQGQFFLRNSLDAGAADQIIRFDWAASTWMPFIGNWGG